MLVTEHERGYRFVFIHSYGISHCSDGGHTYCGIGLGLSVAFRKKGRSKLSFSVQFLGIAVIGLTVILFFLFYGNLLAPSIKKR